MGKKGKAKGRHRAKHDGVASAPGWATRATAGADRTDGANELAAGLVSIGAQLQRRLGHGSGEDGLTRARLSALSRLVLGGPCTLGELAVHEGVRPPTMTRLVRSMEASGLVGRERHPTDGRSIVLHATADGEALLAGGQTMILAPLTTAIAGLGRDERRGLEEATAVLGRFLRDLGDPRRHA